MDLGLSTRDKQTSLKKFIDSNEKYKIIGMGDVGFGIDNEVLVTLALGSCVALAIYDPKANVAGLTHIMQPCSRGGGAGKPGKYADTAVPYMLRNLITMGASRGNLVAKIAGGATMFPYVDVSESIGKKNVDAVKSELKKYEIELIAEDTLGNVGRSVKFYVATGKMVIKTKDCIYEI
ncbi:MAG: chemotaxis protein CheD [Thermoplasmata archaeon]|nr:chemotaxis protein CheD [Euryarchaeota archaeon]RLF66153.1 MAG: chemotaxis protein CheD [Thermoplasmata archaeon]